MRLNQNSTFNRFGNGQKDEITSDKQIERERENAKTDREERLYCRIIHQN